jgi:TonB family protein
MKTLFATITLLLTATATSLAQQTNTVEDSISACTVPHQEARLVGTPLVDRPIDADGVTGTSVVEVTLNPNGAVSNTRVTESSDNFWLDSAALQATRSFKYQSETDNCQSVSGSYLVEFTF